MAYYQLSPFGDDRDDYRMAIVSSTVANVNRRKNSKPYKPEHFIPTFESKTMKKLTKAQMLEAVISMNAQFGGKDLRKES